MLWVYAIYNQLNDKIYIGQTKNLDKRLVEHNQKRGKHYTAKFEGEWKLVYKESVSTRLEAIKRERQLKSQKGRESVKSNIPG
jgi:putative endonuclease